VIVFLRCTAPNNPIGKLYAPACAYEFRQPLRAYTLQGKKAGYQEVLSVGRVQTPLLGIVVKRDEEIENFVSCDFYQWGVPNLTYNDCQVFGQDRIDMMEWNIVDDLNG
jgi:hypothetical protein